MRKLDIISDRAAMVDELIKSFDLLSHCRVIAPEKCSKEELLIFHSSDYIDCLERHNCVDDTVEATAELQEFGLAYDCPILEKIYDYVTTVAGSTLAAVQAVLDGASIAINWNGGWHHAQRDRAAGFCYVNDIVIGIQKLRTKFQKVLYLDLDAHHGDGVEHAFCSSKYVMTVSFHLHEVGYFPGTGDISDIGIGHGKGYSVNAPYARGIRGSLFVPYFKQVTSLVRWAFQPDVCVVQCGADVVSGDRLGGANLLPEDAVACVNAILDWKTPVIFLGGGGYNITNSAKYWTTLTATILGKTIPKDIPDNDYFLSYGPDYVIDVDFLNIDDNNEKHNLNERISVIRENLNRFVARTSAS